MPSVRPVAFLCSEIHFIAPSRPGRRRRRSRRHLQVITQRNFWRRILPRPSMEPQKNPSGMKMAPRESAEETAHRIEREHRAELVQRESSLEQSLAPFKVGSVRYLNAVPLTRGLEDEIIYTVPSELARMLQRDELDAALVSVVEVLFHDRYDILDGIAIASLGEVKSVFLAHKKPLAEARDLSCDTASLTSVELLRILLAERVLKPELKPLAKYDPAD